MRSFIFTNAIDTTTKGINYESDRWSLSLLANFNDTELDGINVPAGSGLDPSDLVDDRDIVFLTDGTPNQKVILKGVYRWNNIDALVRVSNFGEVKDARSDNAAGEPQTFSSQTVTDVSLTGHIADQFMITFGINNVFDVYPDMRVSPEIANEVIYSRRTNQFGTMGRFLNLSMQYNWDSLSVGHARSIPPRPRLNLIRSYGVFARDFEHRGRGRAAQAPGGRHINDKYSLVKMT